MFLGTNFLSHHITQVFVFHEFDLIKERDEDAKAYLLKLPYATYTGTLDAANEIVVFSNVRYAAPPLGNNRWQKPQPPSSKDSPVAGSCFQAYPEWWGREVNSIQNIFANEQSPNDKNPKVFRLRISSDE